MKALQCLAITTLLTFAQPGFTQTIGKCGTRTNGDRACEVTRPWQAAKDPVFIGLASITGAAMLTGTVAELVRASYKIPDLRDKQKAKEYGYWGTAEIVGSTLGAAFLIATLIYFGAKQGDLETNVEVVGDDVGRQMGASFSVSF